MSKSVKIVVGGRRNKTTITQKLNKTGQQLKEQRAKRQRLLTGALYECLYRFTDKDFIIQHSATLTATVLWPAAV
jgi:hypothetical protein